MREPTRERDRDEVSDATAAAGDAGGFFLAPQVSRHVPARDVEMSPDVPACPPASPETRRRRTNPPEPSPQPPDVRLTPLQLAAARAFAKGGRTMAVAAALRVSRRTLSRWQRLAAFRAEIERVHRALSRPPARPAPSDELRPTERQLLDAVYTSAMRQFMKL